MVKGQPASCVKYSIADDKRVLVYWFTFHTPGTKEEHTNWFSNIKQPFLCSYEAQRDLQFIKNSSAFRVAKRNSNTPFSYLLPQR